jgi:hypothetical protein
MVLIQFRKSKNYIVAEEISPMAKQVAVYLRDTYGVNISCMGYERY